MLRLAAIGGFSNMLSPAAHHLSGHESPAKFVKIFDRGTTSELHTLRRNQWLSHGAEIVFSLEHLVTQDLDGIVICAGKNGDDIGIIAKLVTQIERLEWQTKPFILHLSTVSCDFVRAAHAFCQEKAIEYVNYPLTGGVTGAQKASMLILASGSKKIYDKIFQTLSMLGKPKYFGERITAGAEVKLIGHTLVFNGLMGITNAFNLYSHCFNEDISTEEQVAFFDFLNSGAGGTNQWEVALKLGIKSGLWKQGFLLKHAVVDVFYTVQLILSKKISSFLVIPFLQLSLIFIYLLKKFPHENFATQAISKVLLTDCQKISEFVAQRQNSVVEAYLKNCITALPIDLQHTVLLDISVKDFQREFQHGMA